MLIEANGGRNDIEVLSMWAMMGNSTFAQGVWGFFSGCIGADGGMTTSMVGTGRPCNQVGAHGGEPRGVAMRVERMVGVVGWLGLGIRHALGLRGTPVFIVVAVRYARPVRRHHRSVGVGGVHVGAVIAPVGKPRAFARPHAPASLRPSARGRGPGPVYVKVKMQCALVHWCAVCLVGAPQPT